MSYMQIDDWIELEEGRQARMRRLRQPRQRRRQRELEVLGFPIPIERPSPTPADMTELLARIDAKLPDIRKQHQRSHAGRRAVLLENEDLAREVYEIVSREGVEPTIRALDMSRQGITDVWNHYGWPPPIGASNRVRGAE